MSERVTPDELRDTAAMFSAHFEDRGLCRHCLLRWPCDAVVARDALTAAADRIEALEDQNEALRAWPDHPWPDHEAADVSGALADTGDLPGGLRPSAAIRELTRQRDEARGLYAALAYAVDDEEACRFVAAADDGNPESKAMARAARDRLDALMDAAHTVIVDGVRRQEQTNE